jgi:hypothetical protein
MATGPAEWADCQCGCAKVNMWAGEGLCSPCTRQRLGDEEFDRRYSATRADDGSWAGPMRTIDVLAERERRG